MFTDPISDFLTRIRNASRARKQSFTAGSSRLLKSIAETLAKKRFIEAVEGDGKELTIRLRTDRDPLELKRISKPGQRIYVGHSDVKRVRNGLGIGIYSTSQGILTDKEAREKKVGGEYICEVY